MKKGLISSIVCANMIYVLLGCSTTRVVTQKEPLILNKKAYLVTNNQARIGVKLVSTSGDSITAFDYIFNRKLRFHFSEVEKVVVKDHGKGALQGLKLGIVGIIGSSFIPFDRDDAQAGTVPAFYGMVTGTIGAIIGLIKGKTETYLFAQTRQERQADDPQN